MPNSAPVDSEVTDVGFFETTIQALLYAAQDPLFIGLIFILLCCCCTCCIGCGFFIFFKVYRRKKKIVHGKQSDKRIEEMIAAMNQRKFKELTPERKKEIELLVQQAKKDVLVENEVSVKAVISHKEMVKELLVNDEVCYFFATKGEKIYDKIVEASPFQIDHHVIVLRGKLKAVPGKAIGFVHHPRNQCGQYIASNNKFMYNGLHDKSQPIKLGMIKVQNLKQIGKTTRLKAINWNYEAESVFDGILDLF